MSATHPQAGKPAARTGPLGAEVIGPPACPILHRWTLVKAGGCKLLVHHFLPNADDRSEHDHPSPFWTLVLAGGYDDRVPCPTCDGTRTVPGGTRACATCSAAGDVAGDRMRPGMLRRRAATYRHRTRVLPSGAWTVVLMGPKVRPWGFWNGGQWWPWAEHELAFGFGMRCPAACATCGDRGWHTAGGNDPAACACQAGQAWAGQPRTLGRVAATLAKIRGRRG